MIKIMLGFAAWASAVPEDPGEAAKRIEAATPPNRLWNIGRLGGCGGGLELAGSYIVASPWYAKARQESKAWGILYGDE
jgi:hypothetical protein